MAMATVQHLVSHALCPSAMAAVVPRFLSSKPTQVAISRLPICRRWSNSSLSRAGTIEVRQFGVLPQKIMLLRGFRTVSAQAEAAEKTGETAVAEGAQNGDVGVQKVVPEVVQNGSKENASEEKPAEAEAKAADGETPPEGEAPPPGKKKKRWPPLIPPQAPPKVRPRAHEVEDGLPKEYSIEATVNKDTSEYMIFQADGTLPDDKVKDAVRALETLSGTRRVKLRLDGGMAFASCERLTPMTSTTSALEMVVALEEIGFAVHMLHLGLEDCENVIVEGA